MDTTNHDQNETEGTPYREICPRHGKRINRYHGCPKCVMEEVRRMERRIDASFERDLPMTTEAIAEVSVMPWEIG
jgi:hypothetical protein